MALLRAENLEKYLGGERIFSGASFIVREDARLGIVGHNGAGKTTLLRILCGDIKPDDGQLTVYGSCSVSRLSQDVGFAPDRTAMEVAMEAFSELTAMQDELREMEQRIPEASDPSRRQKLLRKYGSLLSAFEQRGGYDTEARARSVLMGLGFTSEQLQRPTAEFSGGERVRLALARMLLSAPDLMLLDEPTNHLDIESTEWLEDYLARYPGAVLSVSHDRYFLDRTVGEILEIHQGAVRHYYTNYTGYLQERRRRRKQQKKRYERQQEEIEKLKAFVRRYKAGQRHKEAKSRQKRLDRMERIPPPPSYEGGINLEFPVTQPSGEDVLLGENVTIRRDDLEICCSVDFRLQRGERVALLGPNGCGKTTLLRALMGDYRTEQGSITWGAGVRIGHFPQDLSGLRDDRTVLQQMYQSHPQLGLSGAREHLARFGFSGDDVFTEVAQLSGGERSRLIFAQLSLQDATVLLLDEPTNHLDLPAREDLERALVQYSGTVVFVTHDRYFVDQVATRIWLMDEGDLLDHHGNYSQLRENLRSRSQKSTPADESSGQRISKRQQRKTDSSGSKQPSFDADDLKQLEGEIARLERQHEELTCLLADPDSYAGGTGAQLVEEFESVKKRLSRLYRKWERVASILEDAQ